MKMRFSMKVKQIFMSAILFGTVTISVLLFLASSKLQNVRPTVSTPPKDDFPDMSFLLRNHLGPIVGPETKHLLKDSLKNKNYLTISFIGGLGNLMFQYASLYGLAASNSFKVTVPEDCAINQIFNITRYLSSFPEQAQWRSVVEYRPNAFDTNLMALNYQMNITITGYLQSWRYFSNVSDIIRQHFIFGEKVQSKAKAFLQVVYQSASSSGKVAGDVNVTFVGVHVRRGDLVTEDFNQKRGYTVADLEYMDRAIAHYESHYKNIIFVVCSDDIKWSMFNVRPRKSYVHFSENHTASEDLSILTLCNHTLMTVGTFGWWAGWLAGGDVVYFKDSPRPGSVLANYMNKEDYYPQDWIAL